MVVEALTTHVSASIAFLPWGSKVASNAGREPAVREKLVPEFWK